VSLVVATVGRSEELRRLFHSLQMQTYKRFEVIVVDQNSTDEIERVIVLAGQGLTVQHLRSARGLSRARNLGLQHAIGDVVGFPDDDCWYGPSLLGQVVSVFDEHPSLMGVVGRCVDRNGNSPARYGSSGVSLNRFSIWTRGTPSPAVFLRRQALGRVGQFDEKLGVGADSPYQSGEETDLLVRVLSGKGEIRSDPTLHIYHEDYTWRFDASTYSRARAYGRGLGRVLRKNRYPLWFALYMASRPVAASLLSVGKFDWRRARYYLNMCAGRLSGWLESE
jgi:glycosyltransferase involved in cell wall biosynthesis